MDPENKKDFGKGDASTSGNDDVTSKQIIEAYYKKFSQNKQLPKYFSGSSVSYIPETIQIDEQKQLENQNKPQKSDFQGYKLENAPSEHQVSILEEQTIEQNNLEIIEKDSFETIEKQQSDFENQPTSANEQEIKDSEKSSDHSDFEGCGVKAASTTSSLTSNRKLEWDNGADIGYDNYTKHSLLYKSTSLPTLLPQDDNKMNNSNSSGSIRNLEFKVASSSSSSLHLITNREVVSSSNSDKVVDVILTSSSSNSNSNKSNYLKKIGSPKAESTPKTMEDDNLIKSITSTPYFEKPEKKPRNILNSKSTSTSQFSNNAKNNTSFTTVKRKKLINLAITKPICIECFDDKKKMFCNKKMQTSITEKIDIAIQTSINESGGNLTKVQSNSQQQTITNQTVVVINCSDDSMNKNLRSINTQTDSEIVSSCDSFEYYKNEVQQVINMHESLKVECSELPTSSQTDKESLHTNLKRTERQSDLAISDSSKNDNLAKLIVINQSENLIVDIDHSIEVLQRLLKSKKYDPTTKKYYIKKIVKKILDSKYVEDSTTSSELFLPKKSNSKLPTNKTTTSSQSDTSDEKVQQEQQFKLQENVPWYPVAKKLSVKTFSDEILPDLTNRKVILTKQSTQNDIAPAKDTLTNNEFTIIHDSPKNESVPNSREKAFSCTSSSKSMNWKEDQTLSERILEKNKIKKPHRGEGDHIVQFARKERAHQLNWINNEISHLCKLRNLLETNPKHCPPLTKHNQPTDVGSIKKTTTVYMVSNQYDKDNNRPTSSRGNQRNYVIQTELPTSGSNSSDHLNFCLCNKSNKKNYQIKEIVPERRVETCNIVGDIEVVSDDTTTNIKVSARKLDDAKTRNCQCMKDPCICCQIASTSTSNKKVCWCKRTPCICCRWCFEPKRPSLVGRNNYISATFPRSNQEIKSNCYKPTQVCPEPPLKKNIQTGQFSPKYKDENVQTCCCSSNKECQTTCKCPDCKNENCQTKWINTEGTTQIDQNVAYNKNLQTFTGDTGSIKNPSMGSRNTGGYQNEYARASIDRGNADVVRESTQIGGDTQMQRLSVRSDNKNGKYNNYDLDIKTNPESLSSHAKPNSYDSPKKSSSTSTSSFYSESSSSSSSSTSTLLCQCCKQNKIASDNLHNLSDKLNRQTLPLCHPCHIRNINQKNPPYTQPGHVCNCLTLVNVNTINEIKKTLNELDKLDANYCTCAKKLQDAKYCEHCLCRLKKTRSSKKGIAYMVTFEQETPKRKKKKKKAQLEEIRIKIPKYKKSHKDKENKKRKERHGRKVNRRESSSSDISTGYLKKCSVYTLQDHLHKNKPHFVESAEERRRSVMDSRAQREEARDNKKFVFLQNYDQSKNHNSKRIFSGKEMIQITKKNYEKLPEFQQKLIDKREKKIRQANRLIADTFNRKLRDNVLKGKRSLPTDVCVLNL